MNSNTKEIVVNDKNAEILPDLAKTPVKWSDIKAAMGLAYEPIKAADLVDQSFVILRAKPFASSFKEQGKAYFCVVQIQPDGEKRQTVLGGSAVVEVLEALAERDFDTPIEFTLKFNDGGQFSGYYTLE